MKMQPDTKPDTTKSQDGLTIDEALAFHAGWAAARKGEPFDVNNGALWVEGWITYGWAKGAPTGSRH